jgi:hypothetical protein
MNRLFIIAISFLLMNTYSYEMSLIENKCCRCHKPGKEKGGLDLQSLMPGDDSFLRAPQKWKRALTYLKSHEMPPQDSKKLALDDRAKMISWLEGKLVSAYASLPHYLEVSQPRRLNNREYLNTLQDLLYLEKTPSFNLPTDNSGYGFDNIADLLSVTPLSMEKYLKCSEQVLDQAIWDQLPLRQTWTFDAESMDRMPKNRGRVIQDIHHLWSNGSLAIKFSSNNAGKYKVQMEAAGDQAGDEKVKVRFHINGKETKVIEIKAKSPNSEIYTLEIDLRAGKNELKISFINDYYHVLSGDRNFHFYGLSINGPKQLPSLPKSHLRLVAQGEHFEQIISRFLERAYRRPISKTELGKFIVAYNKLRKAGDSHLRAVKSCFLAVLVSPKFLFRIEKETQVNNKPINDYELASRLSYFLWSSMPDERLFYLAKTKGLNKSEVLRGEVKRMLKSYRSKQFVRNFSGQWLQVRNLDYVDVSSRKFKKWNGALQDSMSREVYAYFSYVLSNNLPISFFIRGDKTFINDKLAKHYGVEGEFDWDMRAIPAVKNRNSVLSTASVLTVTSEASRTSPVKRGKWVLEEILGFTPPPPPPAVPALEEIEQEHEDLTVSEQLAIHREDPDCAVCHLRMDPIGLSFENYNAIGEWRDKYEKEKEIVLGGGLPDGSNLRGFADVQDYLLKDQVTFQHTLIEKLMIYALGRALESGDYRTLYDIHNKTKELNCRLEDLILEIVLSKTFRYKS